MYFFDVINKKRLKTALHIDDLFDFRLLLNILC